MGPKRFTMIGLIALALVLAFVPFALAQSGAGQVAFDWKPLAAMAINTIVVAGVVQAIKVYAPGLRAGLPWLLPVIAVVAGPAVAVAQSALAGWLGVPIDLSPLLGLATGGAAVAANQVVKQASG